MTRLPVLAAGLLAASCTIAASGALAAGTPKAISAAVADQARPEADRARDAVRKPAQTLAFAGIRPGDKVLELIPGSGYFTRMLSDIVGPKGRVFAVPLPPRPNAPAGAPDPGAAPRAIAADPHYSNVTVLAQPLMNIAAPELVDVVWTSLNYHDLHNIPNSDIAAFNKSMFNLLKPGGTYIIVDHAAAAGAGVSETRKLHRIDPAAVKQEVTAAGFKFDGQGNFLHNPADPHTAPIFDASIRGKTDQFILKFTRPKK